ncbi:hypothetical protein ZWY2020_028628 [Hordeum vulgare]|nr:hypothetical protein ZWY2020_028628 [Hordeum vulgare]
MTSPPRPGAASLSVGTLSRIRVGGSASSIRVSVPHSDTFPPISPPARSPSPGTPATEQGDGSGGEGKQSTRAEVGRVAAIAVGPSPSPGSTVSSSHDDDGRDQDKGKSTGNNIQILEWALGGTLDWTNNCPGHVFVDCDILACGFLDSAILGSCCWL